MKLKPGAPLKVLLRWSATEARPVGRLALSGRRVLFEFAPEFLADPRPLSPFHLPAGPGVHEARDAVAASLTAVR